VYECAAGNPDAATAAARAQAPALAPGPMVSFNFLRAGRNGHQQHRGCHVKGHIKGSKDCGLYVGVMAPGPTSSCVQSQSQ